ncbi:MAG: TorF family putative porin [Burkholderiales bacterium]|nr:TorF family putative porin [Burkholderiales bacterium]
MRNLTKALVVAGTLTAAAAPLAQAEEAMPSVKLSVYSEYEYRGISQTSEKPAGQLNIDWAHSSGFYLGTFVSNIKWLKDGAEVGGFSTSANLEWDIFGGYKFEVAKDVVVDVGYLRYEYPSSGAFNPKPNTDEVYVGVGYGPVSVKYSYSLNDTFGVINSEGSDFIEANIAYPLMDKLTLTGHIGHQKYKNNKPLDYTVYKLGLAYDLGGGWNVGGYVKDTDADSALYTYKGKDWGKSRLVGYVSYTF